MGSKTATAILGVPERLKALQEGSGLKSKADFLRAVKIQKGQWARYLKGEMPGPRVRQRIADATGRSAEWILTGVEQGPQPQPTRGQHAVSGKLGNREEAELAKAIHLVRQLYDHVKLKQRIHDWKVLMALLNAPLESDREHRRARTKA